MNCPRAPIAIQEDGRDIPMPLRLCAKIALLDGGYLTRKRHPALHARLESTKNKSHHLQSRANNAWLEPNGKQLPSFAVHALMENTKMKTMQIQCIVNFVSPVKILHLYSLNVPIALMANINKANTHTPTGAKLARPDVLPLVPPSLARNPRRASLKNWPKRLNTIVNFVSLAQPH